MAVSDLACSGGRRTGINSGVGFRAREASEGEAQWMEKACDLLLPGRNMRWSPWKREPCLIYLSNSLMDMFMEFLNGR